MAYTDILARLAKSPNLLPALATAGAGIAGGLSSRSGARTGTSTVSPVEPAGYSTLGDLLRSRAEARLRSSMDMGGFEASGIQNINDAFRGISDSVNNDLTSRGLGTSPIAGTAVTNVETARGGNIAEFLNSLPLLQRQMQDQDFQNANSLYANRPIGQTQTAVQPGSAAGNAAGSAAEMLAFLQGQGLFSKGIPGAVTGALGSGSIATGLGTASSLMGPGSTAGIAGLIGQPGAVLTGGVASGAASGGAAGGGLGSTIAGLATNPITIGVAAAIAGVTALLKSQAHHEATSWVKGFQNPFDQQMAELQRQYQAAKNSGRLSPEQSAQIRSAAQEAANAYQAKLAEFELGGSDERTVARQAKATADKYYGPNFNRFLSQFV